MADLLAYLHRQGRRPFTWGEIDCWLFVADWIKLATGTDPARDFRAKYSTAREARRIMRDRGGPTQFADELLRAAGLGLDPGAVLQSGDVGLVSAPYKSWRNRVIMVPVGAIFLHGSKWAMKPSGASSLAIATFPIIRAWSLPRA